MSGLRLTVALAFGVGLTFLQFLAVGALNQASAPSLEPSVSQSASPIIIAQPPETIKTVSKEPTPVQTTRIKPITAAAPVDVSALPNLGLSKSTLNLGRLLPSIGELGLNGIGLSEVTSDADQPARGRRSVEPLYPMSAQRKGIEGYVTLRLTIDEAGKVQDVLVVDSEPIGVFERSAREAARRFEFEPARVGGTVVSTTLEKKIVFRLQ